MQLGKSDGGLKVWSPVILVSVAFHGLLLGGALLWSRETPRPRRVVEVAAICLTTGSGHAGGGVGRVHAVKPQIKPQPQPVKKKPRPQRVRERPRRPEIPPPPALALARPSAPAPVRAVPAAAAAGGSGSGRGLGAGRGTGPGSGLGAGSGPGSAPGSGTGAGTALKSYLAEVRRRLEKQKTYPWMARRQHLEGVVVLRFTIGKGGEIAGHQVGRSSGHEVLDDAAAGALQKVGRFPPLPPALGRSRLNIEVPLAFRLSDY
jgi:protein TonB